MLLECFVGVVEFLEDCNFSLVRVRECGDLELGGGGGDHRYGSRVKGRDEWSEG